MSERRKSDSPAHPILRIVGNHRKLLERLVSDDNEIDAILSEASQTAEGMIPDMAYSASPEHPMAGSVYFCNASLAVYLALKSRGVDVHQYGEQMLLEMRRTYNPPKDTPQKPVKDQLAALMEAGNDSAQGARPTEFVYEVQISPDSKADWSMTVKSCAICSSYSKHDAMELVPYMCATDDIMSDAAGAGLRRTGTIALGAKQCDFRYKKNGIPSRVAENFPEQIQLREIDN
jgi:hypothetical protein